MATSTTGTAPPAPTGSALCGTTGQYQIPTTDASCAVPNKGDYRKYMEDCCNSAPVESYNNDCALYCLAVDQSVNDLTKCLFDAGVAWNEVWFSGQPNATATSKVEPSETNKGPDETGTGSTGRPTESPGAAASVYAGKSGLTSKMGLAVCFVVIPALLGGMLV
ncbi:hypothetical protein AJ79_02662 [Helicocarpus griseus UAMH5409]|uniref:Uncharacterized protein n=1 Tax=Helicocarpus griseus UAMH5409 TaxID=1447875 RepID=A0A2B7Y295_9EURO|nr:hypothetical protein AJ79_02662 [Helicocarpus griseus UAMH5409]